MSVFGRRCSGVVYFFSSRRRHTRLVSDWSSDVCSSDLGKCQERCPIPDAWIDHRNRRSWVAQAGPDSPGFGNRQREVSETEPSLISHGYSFPVSSQAGPTGRVRLKVGLFSTALSSMRRIVLGDIDCEGYTNVGIINGDGQTSVPEAAVLGGKLETGLAVPAWPGGGPLWVCSLPCPGWQEARAGQASQRLRLRWRPGGC